MKGCALEFVAHFREMEDVLGVPAYDEVGVDLPVGGVIEVEVVFVGGELDVVVGGGGGVGGLFGFEEGVEGEGG